MNRFSEKILIWVNGPFWTQKLHILITLNLAGRIFFKFCRMKGANRQMRMILTIFKKKFVWGKWTILNPKMLHRHNSGSTARIFLNSMVCSKKIFVQDKWTILVTKMVLILVTLNQLQQFFKKFCRTKGPNRYMKILVVY